MIFWGKAKKKEGWLAFALYADGVLAARVKRRPDAKPVVLTAVFVQGAREQAGAAGGQEAPRAEKAQGLTRTAPSTFCRRGRQKVISLFLSSAENSSARPRSARKNSLAGATQ